jgi:hypothetical protein
MISIVDWGSMRIDQGFSSMKKGDTVGNIVFIDVKYMGILWMSATTLWIC